MPSTRARKPCTKCWRDCSPSPTTSMPASSCTLSQSSVASALARSSSAPLDFHSGQSFSVSASHEGLGRLPAMAVSNIERSPVCTSGRAAGSGDARRLRYRRRVSADADSPAADAEAPLGAGERIAALDVLRGFALLGIFIMNMPGFSHSLFARRRCRRGAVDASSPRCASCCSRASSTCCSASSSASASRCRCAGWTTPRRRARPARRCAAPASGDAVYARRLAFLFVVGLVHAMLLWSGDVLLVYACSASRCSACAASANAPLLRADRRVPALSGADRGCCERRSGPARLRDRRDVRVPAARGCRTTSPTAAARSSTRCARPRASSTGAGARRSASSSTPRSSSRWRPASWSASSSAGAAGRGAARRRGAERRAARTALARRDRLRRCRARRLRLGGEAGALRLGAGADDRPRVARGVLCARRGRLVRDHRELPRWLRRCAMPAACRSATTCCRRCWRRPSSTAGGSASGTRPAPAVEIALAVLLFVAVQLPLSSAWLARFRYGPLEYLWRRFTYGAAPR